MREPESIAEPDDDEAGVIASVDVEEPAKPEVVEGLGARSQEHANDAVGLVESEDEEEETPLRRRKGVAAPRPKVVAAKTKQKKRKGKKGKDEDEEEAKGEEVREQPKQEEPSSYRERIWPFITRFWRCSRRRLPITDEYRESWDKYIFGDD